jgi:Mg-chelatase subunit ChlD
MLMKGEELKTSAKSILFLFIAGAIIFTPQFVRSQNAPNVDVVLVIDSSGSMQKTDPLSLRVPAAKLFISLLEKGDRAGIVSFSDKGYVLSDLTPIETPENKDKLFSAADRISADGLYTNLFEGFKSGYDTLSLQKESGREKIMVLMSDGMMDVGNLDQDARLIDTLESSLTETLRSDNIRVYTIAFTDQSDRKLLEKISKRTGGFYNTALTDTDFHGVFTSIFESLKSPEMVPMSENGFVIDSSIEELTIVATKSDPDTEIQLVSPNGESYSSSHKYSGIGWFASESFDMITILKPLEGRWEILFSTGENNKAYVITNLKLQSDFDQMYAIFGEHLDIRIWLERDKARITEEQVLDKMDVYIELTGPDGNTTKLQAFHKGDGIFQRTFAPFTAGNHKMKLVAEGMTFQRAKSFAFNVANLEESKKDLQEQREEKKKHKEKDAEAGHRSEDEGGVSFIKLFSQFIGMNILIGLIALGYFKREKVKDFVKHINVKGLMQSMKGLTTFIQRKQKGQELLVEQGGDNKGTESAQSAQHEAVKAERGPSTEPAAAETGDQPEAGTEVESTEAIPLELDENEGQTIKTPPQAEAAEEKSTEEVPSEQDENDGPAIEAQSEADVQNTETQGDGRKQMIDLEEIEMEEKGKQEEALQEDKEQMIESLPEADADDLLDAVTQAVEMLQEGTEEPVETSPVESDDIELTPKDAPDQPDETPLETAPEKGPEQPVETSPVESDDIELTPKDAPDQPDETPLETAAEEGTEQPAEMAADLNASDSVIAEMEEAMNQEQPENTDTAAPRSQQKDVKLATEEDISSA